MQNRIIVTDTMYVIQKHKIERVYQIHNTLRTQSTWRKLSHKQKRKCIKRTTLCESKVKAVEFFFLWYDCICRNTLKHHPQLNDLGQVIFRVSHGSTIFYLSVAINKTGKSCARNVNQHASSQTPSAESLPDGPKKG